MSVTPYEWSLRADASNNQVLPTGVPAVQHTQKAQPAQGNSTQQLGDTTFKVTFASGYDPDYYKNIQLNQGLNWDYFKQAGIISTPNTNPVIPGTAAPSVDPGVGGHNMPYQNLAVENGTNKVNKDSGFGLGLQPGANSSGTVSNPGIGVGDGQNPPVSNGGPQLGK